MYILLLTGYATDLISRATDGYWGDWGHWDMCPTGQYVYGFRLQSEPHQGGGDDTALNSIALFCAPQNGGPYTEITSTKGFWGSWSTPQYCSGTDDPVVAFQMRIEPLQHAGDDTVANDVDLYCKTSGKLEIDAQTAWGEWTNRLSCPSGQAVNGIQTRVESRQGNGDDTALNGVRLRCASYEGRY